MSIKWYQTLETGLSWQDQQHRDLFIKLDTLLDAMREGNGREELGSLFDFMDDYVATHFGAEEQAMDKSKYPERAAHKTQHERFKEEFACMKTKLWEEDVSPFIAIQVQRRVTDWVKHHIGSFLKGLSFESRHANSFSIMKG